MKKGTKKSYDKKKMSNLTANEKEMSLAVQENNKENVSDQSAFERRKKKGVKNIKRRLIPRPIKSDSKKGDELFSVDKMKVISLKCI